MIHRTDHWRFQTPNSTPLLGILGIDEFMAGVDNFSDYDEQKRPWKRSHGPFINAHRNRWFTYYIIAWWILPWRTGSLKTDGNYVGYLHRNA